MNKGITIVTAMLLMAMSALCSETTQTVEMCHNETHVIRCGWREQIDIISATVGRMHHGRCLNQDYGQLGCGSSITTKIHRLCSGEQTCTIRHPSDDTASNTISCPKELSQYLSVDYRCLAMVNLTQPREWDQMSSTAVGFHHVLIDGISALLFLSTLVYNLIK